jgi:tetratricopeptide (TPR) repeat protein
VLHDDAITQHFANRRWHAALDTTTNAEAMGIAIVRALGLDPASHRIDSALARMEQAPGLLVLDNLETPCLADPTATEALLARLAQIPGLALLSTYRGGIPPDGPAWHTQHVTPVDDETAFAILHDHAPNIPATDPDWPAFRAALGGLPLAIALIGRRALTHGSLAELWAEWQSQGTAIARRLGVAPHRLTSLDHSIALSVAHASPPALRLFALLGQLPSGIADQDRRALLGTDALPARDDLLRLGLAHAPPGRIDLLPPIRRHAQANHTLDDQDAATWPRHYLSLVSQEEKRMLYDGAAAFTRLSPEVPTIEAAFAAAAPHDALPGVRGFSILASAQGVSNADPLLSLAASCAEIGNISGQALCQYEAADISLDRTDLNTASSRYAVALGLYRDVRDMLGEANCIARLGEISLRRMNHDTATSHFGDALNLFRQIGDFLGEANCIKALGDIIFDRPDYAAASANYEVALQLYRRVNNVLGEANCIARLGDIALRRPDCDKAHHHYREALPLYQKVGQLLGEANCIQCLGHIAQANGDTKAARDQYETALALYHRIPEPFSIGWTHLYLARLPGAPDRDAHLAAAREAWLSIDRADLIAKHLDKPA